MSENNLKYAYYPGCASKEITKEASDATLLVAKRLGIELLDMPNASCCGAGLMKDCDRELNLTINARIFAEAETMGLDILTVCSTCLMVMNQARHDILNTPGMLDTINENLKTAGLHWSGETKTKHLLWAIIEDYGVHNLKEKVRTKLSSLKLAPFYGCHTLRPSDVLGFDDPDQPTSLEKIIDAIGAKAIDYEGKTRCCGFQVDIVTENIALELIENRLGGAFKEGADAFVTPCPFCHINLDNYQKIVEKKAGQKFNLPVFHLAQLIGLSLGFSPKELGLNRHLVRFDKVI